MTIFKKGFDFILAKKKYVPLNDIEYRSSENKAEVKEQVWFTGVEARIRTLSFLNPQGDMRSLKNCFMRCFSARLHDLQRKPSF